jgi:hypothetical protein
MRTNKLNRRKRPVYTIRPGQAADRWQLAEWMMSFRGDRLGDRLALELKMSQLLDRHSQELEDPAFTRSWMMLMNGQPAFCILLSRLGAGRENWIYLLPAPGIRQSDRRLLLAWQAAIVYLFLHEKMGRVCAELPVETGAEIEIMGTLGFHAIEGSSEGSGTVLYACVPEEFMPVF